MLSPEDQAAWQTYLSGSNLSENSIRILRAELDAAPPVALEARLKLLCASNTRQDIFEWKADAIWLIQNQPDSWITANLPIPASLQSVDFDDLTNAWLDLIKAFATNWRRLDTAGKNWKIISNSIAFIANYDASAAYILLISAIMPPGETLSWHPLVTEVFAPVVSKFDGKKKRKLLSAFFEEAEQLCSEESGSGNRFENLKQMFELAIVLGDLDRAQKYASAAKDLIADFHGVWRRPVDLMFGRIALRKDDIESAKQFLLTDHQGYSNMTLAAELFDMGEKEFVAQYLIIYKSTQETDRHYRILDEWSSQIALGLRPSFELRKKIPF